MIQYIYFVKCPNCDHFEDEHFDFFDDAKSFALSCLSDKPIITQVEIDRNDFGECVDSQDLGTVWSWEEVMSDVPTELEFSVLDKKATLDCDDINAEFDALDNSLDSVPDNFRKPVPADMTIEELVEAMEENEDEVECKWCNELYDRSECSYEVDLGWLCDRCSSAIRSRGEVLTFCDEPLEESASNSYSWDQNPVELEYTDLEVTLQGVEKQSSDPYEPPYRDEWNETVTCTYEVDPTSVVELLWDLMTEEDVANVPGGFEAMEADDNLFNSFMNKHFEELVEKYKDKILAKFEDDARSYYEDNYNPYEAEADAEADYWDSQHHDYFDESCEASDKSASMLEELEDSESYSKKLIDCPECGDLGFDPTTGFCIKCGFN